MSIHSTTITKSFFFTLSTSTKQLKWLQIGGAGSRGLSLRSTPSPREHPPIKNTTIKIKPSGALVNSSSYLSLRPFSSAQLSSKKMKDWDVNLDPVQKKLLEEECILLDNDDKVIGHDSKKNCHLIQKNGDVLLHRAFSVFLFNSKGNL